MPIPTLPQREPQLEPSAPLPLLTSKQAAAWLQISHRQIVDRADIPKTYISPPGSTRPQWRYRAADLAALAASRVILPYASRTN